MDKYLTEERVKELVTLMKHGRLQQLEADFEHGVSVALSSRRDELYHSLRNKLPLELKRELAKYSDVSNEICTQTEYFFYERGFSDCISLVNSTKDNVNKLASIIIKV